MISANSIKMLPVKKNQMKNDDFEADFSAKSFYDTVPFVYSAEPSKDSRVVSAIHHLQNYTVPVHDSFTVRIKSTAPIPENLKDRVVMQLVSNHKVEAVRGEWKGDCMETKFRDLGIVKLLINKTRTLVRLSGW